MQMTYSDYNAVFRVGTRIVSSAGLAVLVTSVLLLFMCALIAMDVPDTDVIAEPLVDIFMPEDSKIDVQEPRREPKPPEPQPQPDIPKIEQTIDDAQVLQVSMLPVMAVGPIDVGNSVSSGSAMPIFKVAPQYPRRAIARGIEGFVDLMFDISSSGKTENIRVIHAEPKGYFESASINTLKKWKYKPAQDDGVARVQKNQVTRISYELDQ